MTMPPLAPALLLLPLLLLVGSCATVEETTKRLLPEQQVATMSSDQLEQEFRRVKESLAKGGGLFSAADQRYLAAVGAELGSRKLAIYRDGIKGARIGEVVPITALEPIVQAAGELATWHQPSHEALQRELTTERQRTLDRIGHLQQEADRQRATDPIAAVKLHKQALLLSERTAERETAHERFVDRIVEQHQQALAQAIETADWEQAQQRIDQLQQLRPNHPQLAQQLAIVTVMRHDTAIERAIAAGDHLAARQHYAAVRLLEPRQLSLQRVEQNALRLAEALDHLAAEEAQRGELLAASELFQASQQIFSDYHPDQGRSRQQLGFIDRLLASARREMRQEAWGKALGLLLIANDLNPAFPRLASTIREVEQHLTERAVRRMSTVPFASPSSDNDTIGRSVASKVTQYLFKQKQADLRIVERDTIEQILREQEIRALQGKGSAIQLSAADLLLQGSVVEARVEVEQVQGRKTQRVETGKREVNNPQYEAWMQLGEGAREKLVAPPRSLSEAVTEDVTYGVTIHRKVGIISVTVRLVSAASTKVVFADTVNVKQVYQDESTEGVSLGEFEIPFKIASLPSNVEIMESLTNESSRQIGDKILQALADPELQLAEQAAVMASEADFTQASNLIADALMLAKIKQRNHDHLRTELLQYAAQAYATP